MSDSINIKNTKITSKGSNIETATIKKTPDRKFTPSQRKRSKNGNKILISCSGTTSKAIAEALREWLPQLFQSLLPWMSQADIKAGTRWANELARELSDTDIGIICLTRHNLHAPWILFEAGALSKSVDDGQIIPYLYELKPNMIKGPLAQFQYVMADKEGTLALVKTIAIASVFNKRTDAQIEKVFHKWWPELHSKLKTLK